ncbi:hypothetical protein NKT34_22630 [Paenibacillus polysaccharolyticus]|uniref:hypothetical protein n=1 Tax=Paenibacillus polysaccharolyticus TaxID=582692 RepID=UPI00209E2F82|nr:hypothetical protein [Paenibacillus polysaccharolyticus]MCP1136101.1 hypothetical protein [Paenibacillus polysaccharolyticus]
MNRLFFKIRNEHLIGVSQLNVEEVSQKAPLKTNQINTLECNFQVKIPVGEQSKIVYVAWKGSEVKKSDTKETGSRNANDSNDHEKPYFAPNRPCEILTIRRNAIEVNPPRFIPISPKIEKITFLVIVRSYKLAKSAK